MSGAICFALFEMILPRPQAVEAILLELERNDDDALYWVKVGDGTLFVPIDDQIPPLASDILRELEQPVNARTRRSAAGPFVIALAQLHRITVIATSPVASSPGHEHNSSRASRSTVGRGQLASHGRYDCTHGDDGA